MNRKVEAEDSIIDNLTTGGLNEIQAAMILAWLAAREQELATENKECILTFGQLTNFDQINSELLGNKGYCLYLMKLAGLPVPDGFTLTTKACQKYYETGEIPSWSEIIKQLEAVATQTGTVLDDPNNPLFVAVRSGAAVSMPATLVTVLNVGLNDQTVSALEKEIGQLPAWQAYLKLVKQLVVYAYNLPVEELIPEEIDNLDLLKEKIVELKQLAVKQTGQPFPDYILEQLKLAITGVFQSAKTQDATNQFAVNGLEPLTAVNIMQMAWGNAPGACSLVAFTTNNITGGPPLITPAYGKQGDAAVGSDNLPSVNIENLEIPETTKAELYFLCLRLEATFGCPQDVEAVINTNGEVQLLQTRRANLQPLAKFRSLGEVETSKHVGPNANRQILWNSRLAVEQTTQPLSFYLEPTILSQISTLDLQSLLIPPLDPKAMKKAKEEGNLIGTGSSLSLSHASGQVLLWENFDPNLKITDTQKVLVVENIESCKSVHRLPAYVTAVVAKSGSNGSHGARYAERWGVPVILGIGQESFAKLLQQRGLVTIDASSGQVFAGSIKQSQKTTGLSELKPEEIEVIETMIDRKKANPWAYVGPFDSEKQAVITSQLQVVKDYWQERGVESVKAKEYTALNLLAELQGSSEQIETYHILKPEEFRSQDEVRKLITEGLSQGSDVSFRTCHSPQRAAGGPWAKITNVKEMQLFFDKRDYCKYGYYGDFIKDPDLTECLIGWYPKGKLEEKLFPQHCIWTLSVTDNSEVDLTIRPGTPHLRSLEQNDADTNGSDDQSRLIKKRLAGEKFVLKHQGLAVQPTDVDRFVPRIEKFILDWASDGQLFTFLATLQELFPRQQFRSIVLEGQTGPDWVKVYGIKADVLN